ncbi:MAG: NADH-quinone oxidoreductase subunit H [Methanospirillum sp.]|nr:NADH-quinone oxidoreductase subunit H [Methanospirillum sp.]
MSLTPLLYGVINVLLVLLISPFYLTLIKKVKARVQGRSGPHLLQGYWNLMKLCQKEVIYSDYSSFISRITPYASLALLIVAGDKLII